MTTLLDSGKLFNAVNAYNGGEIRPLSAGKQLTYADLRTVFPQLVDAYGDRAVDFVDDVRRAAEHIRGHEALVRLESAFDFPGLSLVEDDKEESYE
jgi:hypothetical protein